VSAPRVTAAPLARTAPPAPVRMVHLGLGAFHRAHQAWWTGVVSREDPWGIAAFTGRSPAAASLLAAQGGLFTLLVRGPVADQPEVVSSISRAVDGSDTAAFTACLADPAVGVLTLTVTEAGYRRRGDGGLDFADPAVAADRHALAAATGGVLPVSTAPGRILAGLRARRDADAGPLAIVPCDNLIGNGSALRRVMLEFADAIDPPLATWIAESVSFVSTTVDRITPRTTDSDLEAVVRLTGRTDHAPVVTEPFREWVLAGDFPGGRPAWEQADALFVQDVAPYEHRKLWLLNGAHSMLAYAGLLRGHVTVAEAAADQTCQRWVREWWSEVGAHLPQPAAVLAGYQEQLWRRFANPRIGYLLTQVASDGSQKLRVRVVPVLRRERAAGRRGEAGLRILACWIAYLRTEPHELSDPLADQLRASRSARDILALLDPELAADDDLLTDLDELVAEQREGI
jgi:fructuronate reductase